MSETRVFCGALATETNTFSPIPTERRHFGEWFVYPAGAHPNDEPTLFTGPLWVARRRAAGLNWSVCEGLCAAAFPSGRVVRSVYEALRDELLDDLRHAMPLDIVLLGLHGAMAADGYDDCEGDILQRAREIAGPDATIAAELDPHCHLTDEMTSAADILIAFKEYPHTDAMERAEELVELAHQTHIGSVTPVMAVRDASCIAQYFTGQEPAKSLVTYMAQLEEREGVLSVSLIHGFSSGDVEEMGTKALVVTDADVRLAGVLAEDVATRAFDIRATAATERLSISDAVAHVQAASYGPVVIADGADNPGGGAPSDSTYMLAALLEAGVGNVAAGPIWDPIAVDIAAARGEGAKIDLRIGGKASALSGAPLDFTVEVLRILPNASQNFGGANWPMGTVVSLRAGKTDLLLSSVRNQGFTPALFDDAGIDIRRKDAVVLKSNHHFYAAFSKVTDDIVYLSAPGIAVADPRHAAYKHIKRPLWPLDDI